MPEQTTTTPDRLTVQFTMTPDGYTAASDAYPVAGFGPTPIAALYDLQQAIGEYAQHAGPAAASTLT